MSDPFLNLLGLARRASKLSPGHDAALASVLKRKAELILLTSDASERLEREFTRAGEGRIHMIKLRYTMDEIYHATAARAAVLTVDDKGFARKLQELNIREETSL
ncbi:MAG: L7Ae/L30e/S12e/Gadd45 family ribosomal protein [Clostridia bacterium]